MLCHCEHASGASLKIHESQISLAALLGLHLVSGQLAGKVLRWLPLGMQARNQPPVGFRCVKLGELGPKLCHEHSLRNG